MSPAGGDPPQDRDQLLSQAGERKARIYAMVRTILDDLEAVAPWGGLYYPPADNQEFLGMETALVAMIEDIPERVGTLTRALEAGEIDNATRDLIDNADFYFHGIRVSVASELDKLRAKLDAFKTAPHALSPVERTFTCEISADLKGKYTSSIMGAAASLIAEGLWNGVEIEPILFPEKAEEFDRNEKLVTGLSRVTETIQHFLDQVPLAELVASWRQQQRVDQYALAPLYSLLGDLGKLMQVSSRRALYSGDYHQIQQREVLLSARINELTSLHSMTWKTAAEAGSSGDGVYAVMIEKAVELAGILDLDMLKKIIGDGPVKDLFFIVTMEKEDVVAGRDDAEERAAARRKRIPEEQHSLIPLLYDEDLKTFLELLLGSVLKRASLTVKRQVPEPPPVLPAAPAADMPVAGAPAAGAGAVDLEPPELLAAAGDSQPGGATFSVQPVEFDLGALDLDAPDTGAFDPGALDFGGLDPGGAAAPAAPQENVLPADAFLQPSPPPAGQPPVAPAASDRSSAVLETAGRLEALNGLLEVLTPLLSRASSNRKSFELVRRLLSQKRTIPAGLLQSMRPYLYEVMNQLIPQLRDDSRLGEIYADYGTRLFGHCQVLCDPTLTPETGLGEVPAVMEQVIDLLNRLAIAARSSVEKLSAPA